ncbi:MAG: hypothetical protein BGN96_12730 [Bacteroidales bacterium 45-6]|nr:MAG: hypothetical protein BGN96_12730 [Bacteroidales bacterium 45-6]
MSVSKKKYGTRRFSKKTQIAIYQRYKSAQIFFYGTGRKAFIFSRKLTLQNEPFYEKSDLRLYSKERFLQSHDSIGSREKIG